MQKRGVVNMEMVVVEVLSKFVARHTKEHIYYIYIGARG